MDTTQNIKQKLEKAYNHKAKSIQKRIEHALSAAEIKPEDLSLNEMKALTDTFIEKETDTLKEDVDKLLEQKKR